ncbi:MAG: FGGY-family carbohydrate kinase [Firmicutes bacterium]|nr:FGGY-family carbohydrate kinase [Bacillota bacterium]
MQTRLLLGIDQGTSGCKVTAFDFNGQVAATSAGVYPTCYPRPGYAEQDVTDWWNAICRGIQSLIYHHGLKPEEIAAIGVDGTSWACIPVDQNGAPLRKAMIWLDRRAEKQAAFMRENIGEDLLIGLSGNPVDSAYITPKILWMQENEPALFHKTARFLQSNAYLVWKLTGEYSQDYSQGYGYHFFNMAEKSWDEATAAKLNISLDLMAPLRHCHEIAGTVTKAAAAETGLIPGTPVVAGGLDAACCALGAGAIHPGQTQEQGGQAGGMSIVLDKPLIHPRLILGCHVMPDRWLLQGGTVGGGGILKWFNQELGHIEQQTSRANDASPFEIMSQEAERVKPGSGGLIFLPYMAGERSPIWDSKARGVFFGLSYDKTRAHLIRALMEGVGYSLLHNLETASEVKAHVAEMISVGGASNSKVWTQIKADITGKPIRVPYSDHATALGAAILGGVGTKIYRDFDEAVRCTVKIRRNHEPDWDNHYLYRKYYQIYLELYPRLKSSFEVLDNVALEANR